MEVVINACYGGFGLSKDAVEMYLKLKGKECFTYTNEANGNGKDRTYIRATNECLFNHHMTKDLGEKTNKLPDKYYFSDRDINRDDKDLVSVVKKLGDKANGSCSKLKVIEIPDGIEWDIEEYDGLEHIAEKHKIWN